ncbi:MAG: hypothetical protein L0Z62_34145, partial [Gemmataceae bacterium]|nr:hypothetical protein [Gemmataceae bacterium]
MRPTSLWVRALTSLAMLASLASLASLGSLGPGHASAQEATPEPLVLPALPPPKEPADPRVVAGSPPVVAGSPDPATP